MPSPPPAWAGHAGRRSRRCLRSSRSVSWASRRRKCSSGWRRPPGGSFRTGPWSCSSLSGPHRGGSPSPSPPWPPRRPPPSETGRRWSWKKAAEVKTTTCPVYLKAPEMAPEKENSLIKRAAAVENSTLCDNQQAALHFPPRVVTFNKPRLSLWCHQSLTAVFICVPAARTLTGCPTRLKNNKTRLFSLSANPFFLLHLVHEMSNAVKKRIRNSFCFPQIVILKHQNYKRGSNCSFATRCSALPLCNFRFEQHYK